MFLRAQAASFAGSVVDFGTLFILTEGFKFYYMVGVVSGAILGAVANFTLGRYWSFKATKDGAPGQAFRYFIVALGSLILNSSGVYIITEYLHIPYWISKIVTSFFVGVVYNYFMQKNFVFRKLIL
jgi:putative flippase GtrA